MHVKMPAPIIFYAQTWLCHAVALHTSVLFPAQPAAPSEIFFPTLRPAISYISGLEWETEFGSDTQQPVCAVLDRHMMNRVSFFCLGVLDFGFYLSGYFILKAFLLQRQTLPFFN